MTTHAGFHFIANLKPYTVHRGAGNRRFDAYLLSSDFARTLRDLAREVVADGAVLCADNGNFDAVRAFVTTHEATANALEAERQGLGSGAISDALRTRYRAFATELHAASAAMLGAGQIAALVRGQQAMSPTYQIGAEDFTVGALTAYGIRPDMLAVPSTFYRRLARTAIELAVETQAGKHGPCTAQVFATVHALDYDTGRIAGREAGRAGVSGIAASMVGSLQDKTFITSRIERGKVIELGDSIPRPYVAVAEILAGLHEGHVETSGRRPSFHALGMGTPILLPLLAALGDGDTFTASDSTAPIVDGWTSPTISLYVDDPAPLKYKAHKLVETWLKGGRGWDCPCPYCRAFERVAPTRLDEARRWWREQGEPAITPESMRGDSPLSGWLPLLGNAADPGLRLGGAMARVGHNHWVLQRIETAARTHGRTFEKRIAWGDGVVAAYLAAPSDPAWQRAVSTAWSIIRRAAERTKHARGTPLRSAR